MAKGLLSNIRERSYYESSLKRQERLVAREGEGTRYFISYLNTIDPRQENQDLHSGIRPILSFNVHFFE